MDCQLRKKTHLNTKEGLKHYGLTVFLLFKYKPGTSGLISQTNKLEIPGSVS